MAHRNLTKEPTVAGHDSPLLPTATHPPPRPLLPPRRRPALGLLHPRRIRIRPTRHLPPHHPPQHLGHEADEIMPPQRILPPPPIPLPPLRLQRLPIAHLARPHPRIRHHRQQIEAYLARRISPDAPLQHGNDLVRKVVEGAAAVRDGRGLQAVELVERVADGGVRDEVVDGAVVVVVVGRGGGALRLVDERRGAGKGVVHGADEGRVGEGFAAELLGDPLVSYPTLLFHFPSRVRKTQSDPDG